MFLLIAVRGAPERAAAARVDLVRGTARLPPEEHDPAVPGGGPHRAALPLLLARLHRLPVDAVQPEAQEALHKVHLQLVILLYISL